MTPYTKKINTKENNRPNRPNWQEVGGQYRPAIGTSTGDKPDHEAALEAFNRELQAAINATDWSQPF